MKKALAIILTIFSMLLILDSINFSHALMMFLLAGVIPGTNIALNGDQMLEFCFLIVGFILARITLYAIRRFKPQITHITKARA